MGPWSTELFVLGCCFCFDLIFLEVGQGALCGLFNVLFIKSRAWPHVQFAMVGDVQEACVHPCPRCDCIFTQRAGRETCVLAMPVQIWGVSLIPPGSVKMNFPLLVSKVLLRSLFGRRQD